jgi:hypothetical protein
MPSLKNYFKKPFVILLAFFALSVAIRIPNLDRPLSKHHEFCTAVALRIIQIWDVTPISQNKFRPIMTYPNEMDRHINNSGTGLEDLLGNQYYISHPPFAYILPYFVFKVIRVHPNILGLQIFHMFFHFLCGIFIYLIICIVCKNIINTAPSGFKDKLFIPALAGYLLYIFNPCTLWFQSNVYMSDMFVQTFWFAGVYVMLRMIFDQKQKSLTWLAALFVITYLMALTEWLGYFFIVSVVLFALFKFRKDKTYIRSAITSIAAGLLSLSTTIYIYSGIAGLNPYLNAAFARFKTRSGHDGMSISFVMKFFIVNYASNYLPLLLLLLIFAFLIWPLRKTLLKDKRIMYFTFFALVPVFLHHFIFLNYTGHDFAMLKASLFFSVAGGYAFCLLSFGLPRLKTIMKIMIAGSLVLMIGLYYWVNMPGNVSWKGDRYDTYKVLGKRIKAASSPDEVVFLTGFLPYPEMIIYAERNVQYVENEQAVEDFLKLHNQQKGILFEVKGNEVHKRLIYRQ